jgi:hypothetical protein
MSKEELLPVIYRRISISSDKNQSIIIHGSK